jgi:3',5'-cyclic-AMP phosphodiesterase
MSSFRIAQISDTHLREQPADLADRLGPDACLERTVDALRPHSPDAVLLTGDIADDGSVEGTNRVRTIVERLGIPIIATPGNHDVTAMVEQVFGSNSVTVPGWEIVVVNTVIPATEHGRVDIGLLQEQLAQTEGRPTLIAMHHPPITLSTHRWFQLDGASDMVRLITQHRNVKAVVSGHLHQAFAVQIDHVSYVGCPSALYAITHTGNTWAEAKDGLVGANLYDLNVDGAVTWQAITRP